MNNKEALTALLAGQRIQRDKYDTDDKLYYIMDESLVIYKVEFHGGHWFSAKLDDLQRIFWNSEFRWKEYLGEVCKEEFTEE